MCHLSRITYYAKRQYKASIHLCFARQVYKYVLNIPELNTAEFILHQSTEHCFAYLLSVLTNYKPYTHNLILLASLVFFVLPRCSRKTARCIATDFNY